MSKILLALQYWNGDKAMAMQLARLIADLEDRHCDKADFLLFSRFDTPDDPETTKYVQRKFNVWTGRGRRRSSGWPHGCNDLWFGTMDWIYTMQEAKKIPQYKAVFTFEADGCPLLPQWINILSQSWDRAQMEKLVYVYGAYLLAPAPHVNGNAMFSCDREFLHWLTRKVCGVSPHGGWDFLLADEFERWGSGHSKVIKSYWRKDSFTKDEFIKETQAGVAYLHGVKDMSAIRMCRKLYGLPPGGANS
jgi:hypothetical protein